VPGDIAPPFLTSALGGELSVSHPSRGTPIERPPLVGGPRTCLDALEYRKTSCPYRNPTQAIQLIDGHYTGSSVSVSMALQPLRTLAIFSVS
jgi:hypothetical protein